VPNVRKITSKGWGNFPKKECQSFRPEKKSDITSSINNATKDNQSTLIPNGAGCSYGDAVVTSDYCLNSLRLCKFIEFDTEKGILKCEGGVTLDEIMNLTIPKGWILPVIPGTKLATIAGAFACNIHGKNHYKEGDLAKHVKKIKLHLANNEIIECSSRSNKDLFWATAGGMGMTGFIEEVTIKLKPIESLSLKSISQTVDNIDEMLELFDASKDISDYMIGWIDHSASNENIGKGVFEKANHICQSDGGLPLSDYKKTEQKITIPFYFPPWILNKYSMKIYNILRFKKYSETPQDEIIDFDDFFHPLDKIKNWNKLYGKNGFIQYQCIIPETDETLQNIKTLLTTIKERNLFSYLAVIKYHSDNNYKNPTLVFTQKGYSIALDFPNTEKVRNLICDLNDYITNINGKTYLAKDALLTEEQFNSIYNKKLTEWKKTISDADPNKIFVSEMSKRLGFKNIITHDKENN